MLYTHPPPSIKKMKQVFAENETSFRRKHKQPELNFKAASVVQIRP